jgi:hypothetical protein
LRHNPGDVIDGRLRPIKLGNLAIDFQHASPSRLYWAGRPAMRFVQALHWIRDMLPSDDGGIQQRLLKILNDPDYGMTIQKDLQDGWHALPDWMRVIIRDLLRQTVVNPKFPFYVGRLPFDDKESQWI